MDQQLRIKQIAQYYGIPEPTIRYFEQKGLIQSHRNANNYRYYTYEDINQISDLVFLRNGRFSEKELCYLLTKANRHEYNELLAQQQLALKRQIADLKRSIAHLQHQQENIQLVENNYAKVRFVKLAPKYFVEFQYYATKQMTESKLTFAEALKKGSPVSSADLGFVCTLHNQQVNATRWGLFLNNHKDKSMKSQVLPANQYLLTIADLQSEGQLPEILARLMKKYRQLYQIDFADYAIGKLLLRCHQDGQRQRFAEIYFPIKA
ncbi:MerR family transcriptional regulator [Limosilactobacillus kribbianus]|uniref:MerR family transcriptional regulator n=1 Tax=Limosilactobacillus kribbianus TaxID=2982695 RepID=UPI0022654C28|nr:MerR family transcriptional regulator [Limosilactobacillus kribbianus]